MATITTLCPACQPPRPTRERLLDAAFRSLEKDGPDALKARTLTSEIGVSTMAVYTHFGGMPGLIDAMVREGLARFAAHVRARPPLPDDPMADLISGRPRLGRVRARELAALPADIRPLERGAAARGGARARRRTAWRLPEGVDAFSILLESVERVIEAGEIRPQDPRTAAIQILSATHGYVAAHDRRIRGERRCSAPACRWRST